MAFALVPLGDSVVPLDLRTVKDEMAGGEYANTVTVTDVLADLPLESKTVFFTTLDPGVAEMNGEVHGDEPADHVVPSIEISTLEMVDPYIPS